MHLQNVKHDCRGYLRIAGLCLLGNKEIELWLFLIGGKVLSFREMDCKVNLEWKLIPLPCAWVALLSQEGRPGEMEVGQNAQMRNEKESGKWKKRIIKREMDSTGLKRKYMERQEKEGRESRKKKVQKKKQGDPENVIRGDMMAVGVVSCLD